MIFMQTPIAAGLNYINRANPSIWPLSKPGMPWHHTSTSAKNCPARLQLLY